MKLLSATTKELMVKGKLSHWLYKLETFGPYSQKDAAAFFKSILFCKRFLIFFFIILHFFMILLSDQRNIRQAHLKCSVNFSVH